MILFFQFPKKKTKAMFNDNVSGSVCTLHYVLYSTYTVRIVGFFIFLINLYFCSKKFSAKYLKYTCS